MTIPPVIDGTGTLEATWRTWLEQQAWQTLDLAEVTGRRVVVVSAHPDDDVLAVGGLLCRIAELASSLSFVWATDGEASHPQSTAMSPAELASLRRAESHAAIGALGFYPSEAHHLGLPDGGLQERERTLASELDDLVGADDLVLAPWAHDGHPDHEAAGKAAMTVRSWRCWQYPIWMWHWAQPGDDRVPWATVRSSPVPNLARKAEALSMFATQVAPIGPDPGDEAILPPHVLARFQRDVEVIFT